MGAVRAHGDRAAALARSASPVLLAAAEALHAGYRAALSCPESFARARSRARGESSDLVERSVRAEFAVALGVSERVASRELERAQLLVEELPCTRAALAAARLRWEAGQAICAVARLWDELHAQPLGERHERARADRGVWLTPEIDGMATVCAYVPAPVAVGALARLDRIARSLRDGDGEHPGGGDERTLAQLRADAWGDLLCRGDVAGTAPSGEDEGPATFVPGLRAEVRLTLAVSTASGADDAPAELDGYGPIPAETARDLVGVGASLTRVLTDAGTGAVVSVGRTHRVPPPRMRLLLQLRDQTCRFPGCTRPASTAEWTTPTGRRVTTRPPVLPGRPPGPRPRFVDTPPPF